MSRDDSLLYSGATSASFTSSKTNKVLAEVKESKRENRIKLSPVSELVMGEFDKEIEKLQNIDYVNIEQMMLDEHFKAEMMARKKTIEKLREIKGRLQNILRKK
jgi:hypothetical protein